MRISAPAAAQIVNAKVIAKKAGIFTAAKRFSRIAHKNPPRYMRPSPARLILPVFREKAAPAPAIMYIAERLSISPK